MTKEEILEREFVKGMKEKNFKQFKKDYPTLLKVVLSSMEQYNQSQLNNLRGGWININDRDNQIPKEMDDCLILLEDGKVRRYSEDWESENPLTMVTHWQPLPNKS